MAVGIYFIVCFVTLYLIAILMLWHALQKEMIQGTSTVVVPFTLQEGQTILGVMDTAEIMCFCIGNECHAHSALRADFGNIRPFFRGRLVVRLMYRCPV
jgi:hypothetical protein